MVPRQCPKCQGPLIMDKDTTSGIEYREYHCPRCRWHHEEERGPALWKILADERDPKKTD